MVGFSRCKNRVYSLDTQMFGRKTYAKLHISHNCCLINRVLVISSAKVLLLFDICKFKWRILPLFSVIPTFPRKKGQKG